MRSCKPLASTLRLEYHPLPAVCIFYIFTAVLHIRSHPQAEDAPCGNDKDPHNIEVILEIKDLMYLFYTKSRVAQLAKCTS
jgi:hypothetical protein